MAIPANLRQPNTMLRAIRLSLCMSQHDFACAIRQAGEALGEPNMCNKRLVQKWESGEHAACRSNYRRALERVTRRSYRQLGFADSRQVPDSDTLPPMQPVPDVPVQSTTPGNLLLAYMLVRLGYTAGMRGEPMTAALPAGIARQLPKQISSRQE